MALLPSGDQPGDVRYVLIVNNAGQDSTSPRQEDGSLDAPSPGSLEGSQEGSGGQRIAQLDSLFRGQGNENLLNDGDELMCHICNYTSPQRYDFVVDFEKVFFKLIFITLCVLNVHSRWNSSHVLWFENSKKPIQARFILINAQCLGEKHLVNLL